MFDRDIVSSDNFTEMSSDAQNLYFHLGIQADDEGFVTPKGIMRMISASPDSLKILIAKGYVIPFESGVVVITAWNQNNFLDKNRVKPTKHQKERALLTLTGDKSYEFNIGLTRVEESSVEERRIEQSIYPSKSEISYTDEYETFWKLYPRKIGKGAAWLRWKKLNLGGGLKEKIFSAVEKQKLTDQWQKDGGQFIPHPATWLNQRRWEDEVETTDKKVMTWDLNTNTFK